jgi:hypothetical protein
MVREVVILNKNIMRAYYNNGDNIKSLVGKKAILHLRNGGLFAGKIVEEHKHLSKTKYLNSIVFVGFCPFHIELVDNNPHNFKRGEYANIEKAYSDVEVLDYKTSEYLANAQGETTEHVDFILELSDKDNLWDAILRDNKDCYEEERQRLHTELMERFK